MATKEEAIGRAVLLAAHQRNRVFIVYHIPAAVLAAYYAVRGGDVAVAPTWAQVGCAYWREGRIAYET
jgi:hypothetical protein